MSKKGTPKRSRSSRVDERNVPRIAQGKRPADLSPPRKRTFSPPEPGNVVIQFGQADVNGPWCLSRITSADHVTLLQRIASIETMTMHEAVAGGAIIKDYEIEKIPNQAAVKHLADIGLDDQTRISRIQVSGPGRLYGFRRGDRFHALWWDPKHEIWPRST